MSTTRNPATRPLGADESPNGQVSPVPDEDGPHDVPDDMVIEKTLPSTPLPDGRGSASDDDRDDSGSDSRPA